MKRSRMMTASVVLGVLATTGPTSAFDCRKATQTDEFAICQNCDLRVLDEKMATLYGVLTQLVGMGQRGQIRDDQKAWLQRRQRCGEDVDCLFDAYEIRIAELEGGLKRIYQGGPY